MSGAALPQLVEHLFRHGYGRMVAGLVRIFGSDRIDLCEDVVQEALLRALRRWPAEGVPDQPEGWVFRVARNLAVDSLRRRTIAQRTERELQRWAEVDAGPEMPSEGIEDDTLRMMFTCCHPAVPPDTRVPLVLKTVGGFGIGEIAAALLQKEGTISQRLTRAKARLQGLQIRFEVPAPTELPVRLPLVLEVLYLMFNEGYRAFRGPDLVRQDLVEEAVRLCSLLLREPSTALPEVHALLALMLFLGARLPARSDPLGEILTLADQDRSRWDQSWLQCGFEHFRRSIGGDVMTAFHCEAAIASVHAAAPDYLATDWHAVLREYDRLLCFGDSPVVRLNRAVALAKVEGPRAGLGALAEIQADALTSYLLLPATAAWMRWQLGEHHQAAELFDQALALPCSEPERRLLLRRRDACRSGEQAPSW